MSGDERERYGCRWGSPAWAGGHRARGVAVGVALALSLGAASSARADEELAPLDGIDDDVIVKDAPQEGDAPAPPEGGPSATVPDPPGGVEGRDVAEDVGGGEGGSSVTPDDALPSVEDDDGALDDATDAEGPREEPEEPVAPAAADDAEAASVAGEDDAGDDDLSDIEEEPITVDELLAATSEGRREAAAREEATDSREVVRGAGVKDSVSTYDRKDWIHSGFFLEPRLGATGCFGPHCRGSSGHAVSPGVDVGFYLGGNIAGIVDVGVEGSWGRLNPGDLSGRNVFELYGVNPATFEDVVNAELRSYAGGDGTGAKQVDFSELVINGATTMKTAGAGPLVRVHFIRYGRGSFYLGTGAQWRMWGNRYQTELGDVALDFHGIALPAAGGLGFYPIKHLMIGAEFRYVFTHYFLSVIDHPDLSTYSPMSLIDEATAEAGSSISSGLPGFWNASVTMRVRF